MSRVSVALALAGLVLVAQNVWAVESRYSGTILAVDASGQSITLEELGAGPRGKRKNEVIARPIALTASTKILLVTRVSDDQASDWPGGFKETPIAATDLQKGDYATVRAEPKGGRLIATLVQVVRPVNPPR
jgi:hypothetical protein